MCHVLDGRRAITRQARAILAEATDGNPGRYFEFYAARNYFDRAGDHGDTALHNEKVGELVSAAAPEAKTKACVRVWNERVSFVSIERHLSREM